MSHKSWMPSLSTGSGQRLGIRGGWRFPASQAADVNFLRSWLVYDSKFASARRSGKFNWNFLIGMLLAGGASAGFWAGIGMAIANWR